MNVRHYLFFPEKNRQCLILLIEHRLRSDCVHEQVAKQIANVRFISGLLFKWPGIIIISSYFIFT